MSTIDPANTAATDDEPTLWVCSELYLDGSYQVSFSFVPAATPLPADVTHTPGPFAAQRAGCGAAAISSGITGPSPCPRPPTWAGLVYFPYPRPGETRWAFTCDHHRDHLTAPRRLLDRDRAELARRRERERAVLVDHAR